MWINPFVEHFYPNLSTKKTLLGLFYGLRGRDSSGLAPRPQHCFGPPDGVHLRERTPLYRVFLSTSLHKRKAPLLGLFYGGEEGIRTPDTVAGIHDFESRAFNQLCHLSTLRTASVATPILKNSQSCLCLRQQTHDLFSEPKFLVPPLATESAHSTSSVTSDTLRTASVATPILKMLFR